MKILLFLFSFFITQIVLADSFYPITTRYSERLADVLVVDDSTQCKDYLICNPVFGCKAAEWHVFSKQNGFIIYNSCRLCPEGFERSFYTLTDGTYVDDICRRPCPQDYKEIKGMCQSCPEIYKEWRIDDPELGLQCLTKKCGSDQTLDTLTGSCVQFDPECEKRGLDTIAPSGSKPFCSFPCRVDPKQFLPDTPMQYRSANFSEPNYFQCRNYPECPSNHVLKKTDVYVSKTLYQHVECQQTCSRDENLINGKCYKKCSKDEQFIDGKCVDTDPIVESINLLKFSVSDSFNKLSNNLQTYFNDFSNSFSTVNDELDQVSLKLDQNQNTDLGENSEEDLNSQVDVSSFDAQTPVYGINLSNYLSIDKFNNNPQCPPDRSIQIWGSQFTFKYSLFCNSLEIIGKIILVLAFVYSLSILKRDE